MVAQNQPREMFRFTSVWRELISLLQDQVALKRRRYLTRTTQAVFSGSNAVDVLLRHVQKNPQLFPDRDFARPNVVRLCQRFLDLRVFFPAKEKSSLKLIFEDSHFAFYRFNSNHDFIGSVPSQTSRGLKRCNSETDLIAIEPNMEQKATLTKQLSAISCRLRKSIRRRSSHTKDKLASISEEATTPRLTKFNSIQEVSESPKLPRKKTIRRSLQMKTPTTTRRITRSNAFRSTKILQGRRASCGDTSLMNASIQSEHLHRIDDDKISLLNSTVCGDLTRVPKRSLKSFASERSKKVKSIAAFSMNMSLVL